MPTSCLIRAAHELREASRVEARAGSHISPPTWRGRDGSRRTPRPTRFTIRIDVQHDPRHLAPIGTFRIRIEQAHVGDGALFVVGGERGTGSTVVYRCPLKASAVSLPGTTGTISNAIRSDQPDIQRCSKVMSSASISWKHRPRSAATQLLTNFNPTGIMRPLSRKRR